MSVFTKIDSALHAIYRCCGYLAAAFIVAIGGLVLVNITSRFLGIYVPGMTEGAGYCMAATGALGLAYTFGEHGHIRVSVLISRLRGKFRRGFDLWALGVSCGLSVYLAGYLLRMVYVSYLYQDRSDGSDGLLIWIPQAPMAAGFAIFAVSLLHAVLAGFLTGKTSLDRNGPTDPQDIAGH